MSKEAEYILHGKGKLPRSCDNSPHIFKDLCVEGGEDVVLSRSQGPQAEVGLGVGERELNFLKLP